MATTVRHLRAAAVLIGTWSSRLAEVGIESTLAGNESVRFSDTRAAARTCTSIMPELRPGCGVRKPGRPLRSGFTKFSTRRSLMLDRSVTAAASRSDVSAIGWAWKLPPLSTSPVSGKTSGLSVAAFSSRSTTDWMNARASRSVPWTCGRQRML